MVMPAVSYADQFSDLLMQGIQAIVKAANLGPVGYALIAATTLLLFFFRGWLKKKEIEMAQKASESQAVQDQSQNTVDNQNASANWNHAHDTIDQVRRDNPDTEKRPR
jgi:uncharacterized membrane protein